MLIECMKNRSNERNDIFFLGGELCIGGVANPEPKRLEQLSAIRKMPVDGSRSHAGSLSFGASHGPSDRARYNLQPGLKPGSLSDFGAGFGPKGLGNLAQALAWVASQLNAISPEGTEEIVI